MVYLPNTGVIAATEDDVFLFTDEHRSDWASVACDHWTRVPASLGIQEPDFTILRSETDEFPSVCVNLSVHILTEWSRFS